MQTFECNGCHEISKTNYQDNQGKPCEICEHCGAKNKVVQLPTKIGAPIQLKVVGLLED